HVVVRGLDADLRLKWQDRLWFPSQEHEPLPVRVVLEAQIGDGDWTELATWPLPTEPEALPLAVGTEVDPNALLQLALGATGMFEAPLSAT
ncbi:hypothetical protein NL363_29265, partial [Klebsiella pneumoniae]|nr:hypothetical protein [Klebsiella pneumoniae]